MGTCYALIIALENYADKTIKRVRFAGEDGRGIETVLQDLEYDARDIQFLLNGAATRTAIESSARLAAKMLREDDTMVVFYAGHGFASQGQNYLAAFDTRPRDAVATSLRLRWLFDLFRQTPCRRVLFFLDHGHGGLSLDENAGTSIEPPADDELQDYFEGAESHVVFAACRAGELSRGSFQFQHGFWTYHLMQALSGEEPRVISDGRCVTSADLQDYLRTAVPRDVQLQHASPTTQNPVAFGHISGAFAVVDLAKLLARKAAQTPAIGLEGGVLRGEKSGRVADLSGFNKAAGHKAPQLVTQRTRDWVAGLSGSDLDTAMEKRFQEIKSTGWYRGDDLEYDPPNEGSAAIRTPDFHFTLTFHQDDIDSARYVETRQLTRLNNGALLQEAWFNDLFRGDFDQAVLDFSAALDVAEFISRVEGKVQSLRLDYDARRTYCTLRFPALKGSVTVTDRALIYRLGGRGSPGEIVDGFQEARALLSQAPEIQNGLPLPS